MGVYNRTPQYFITHYMNSFLKMNDARLCSPKYSTSSLSPARATHSSLQEAQDCQMTVVYSKKTPFSIV